MQDSSDSLPFWMLKLLLLVTLGASVVEVNQADNDRRKKGGDKIPEKDLVHIST